MATEHTLQLMSSQGTLTVSVDTAEDGAIVVFIDTTFEPGGNDTFRVRVNDALYSLDPSEEDRTWQPNACPTRSCRPIRPGCTSSAVNGSWFVVHLPIGQLPRYVEFRNLRPALVLAGAVASYVRDNPPPHQIA